MDVGTDELGGLANDMTDESAELVPILIALSLPGLAPFLGPGRFEEATLVSTCKGSEVDRIDGSLSAVSLEDGWGLGKVGNVLWEVD